MKNGMAWFSILSFLIPVTGWSGNPVIFSGNDVKTLKSNIDLNGNSKVLSGTTDPSSVAVSAPIGSVYLNNSNGLVYRKTDSGLSTNWTQLASAVAAAAKIPPVTQKFLTGGSSPTYTRNYAFTITSGSATAGATYTHNSSSYTVFATVSSATLIYLNSAATPLSSGTLTKSGGTGDTTLTFSAVASPLYLTVTVVGAGGGGSGSGSAGGTAAGDGTGSTFGPNISANGGLKGTFNSTGGGAGGSASPGSGPSGITLIGGAGTSQGYTATGLQQGYAGGVGGNNPLGGAGSGGFQGLVGGTASANTGGGGGGAGGNVSGVSVLSGSGGGAGGYARILIPGSNSLSVTIGTGGSAGGAGTSGFAGGAGADGGVWVDEIYQ